MGVKNINKSAFMPDLNILLPIVCTFRKELEKSWHPTSYMQNCHCLTVIITSTFITQTQLPLVNLTLYVTECLKPDSQM